MVKDNFPEKDYGKLMGCILNDLMAKGLKATTMDSIASSLQISKRTLYEIFDNKDDMIEEALSFLHNKIAVAHKNIFESSSNILEAILRCFLYNRDLIRNANPEFFRDVEIFLSKLGPIHKNTRKNFYESISGILRKGVEEGYFRNDINIEVNCRIMMMQMESLKRMEEFFPPDITPLQVYDSISIGFLRSISTVNGLTQLDDILKNQTKTNYSA